ncbi:MAG TPA: hypothetical protein VGP61_03010 [Gemmatimonadales bacterium]|jgi:hypothetical protein|nr:hypothetical protein [Gemmatimonadales bacterium]
MRGRILQYNGSDGSGVITADGQQYKFTITAWKSATAPAVGKTVELVTVGDQVQSVTLVGDDVLLREKTAELTGKLGGLVGDLTKGGASGVGGSLVARYGVPLLVAYAVFLISTLAFNALSMQMLGMKQGVSLFDLGKAFAASGGGGGGAVKLLLLLAYASIAAPLVWPDKRAWLALLLPLLAVLWGFLSIRRVMGGAGPMSELFSYGLGFYLAVIAALVLAVGAWQRYRAAA